MTKSDTAEALPEAMAQPYQHYSPHALRTRFLSRHSDLSSPPRFLVASQLSVSIKSAAVRVVTRYPSPAPRRLLTTCSKGHVQPPEERINEHCLLLGVAR